MEPTNTNNAATAFPPPGGEETSFALDDFGLTVRHGSSLSITAQVCTFLSNPIQNDSFNYVEPNDDHHKWGRKGMSLYYACVMDKVSVNSNGTDIICALRAATESNGNSNNSIFLIDYVYTDPKHRERGIAGKLISKVLEMAKTGDTILGVLSLEDSCVYWLEKWNFVLCQNTVWNERLNVFPDTHLLIHKECNIDAPSSEADNRDHDDIRAASIFPPEQFVACLKQLQVIGTSQPAGISQVLKTVATLIQNAKHDESEDGKRQIIRISNKVIHHKVFAVGGETAMTLLQVCGWQLGVNDDGDTVLKFIGGHQYKWLDAAVAQLEYESMKG